MKKFTFKNVLDGFRSSVTQPVTNKTEHATIEETLRPEFFQVSKTIRHGFPYQPMSVAFDPIQKLLAVGTKRGSIRIIGIPGVDVHLQHENEVGVFQMVFLPNAGALVSVTQDDSVHLWNFRQKRPEVVHSLKFTRERITVIHLPFQSKFLYIGTERGNIYMVNIEVFLLSGYVINWNKAIELSMKNHPGSVLHLSDCPVDPNKLLIGYESGQIVIWDLRTKAAESRYQSNEPLRSISWHHEGKQFMVSHTDGSLTTWTVRQTCPKPVSTIFPHAKTNKEGKQETCKCIQKVEWTCSKNGDSFVIFSGGLTNDRSTRTPSITVIHGKTTTVLEMEHNVVDFITLCETPWRYDFAEPYALVVLLHNDLVVVDLHSKGYPCFENPYSMDFHEAPVTCCSYIADCPADLVPALYSIGARSQKRAGFSDKEWPISGGKWGSSCSYSEMVITGHADGSLKFWDASSVTVQILYKLKSAKIFEKPRTKSIDGDEDPFAVHHISLCPESRLLCIAGATSHIICFKYSKQETSGEVQCLEIPIVYEVYESGEISPENDFPPHPTLQASVDYFVPIHVKAGIQKKAPGYQAELVCLTPWVNGEPPGIISALSINSSYGLIAYGNESGLVIVDYIQKVCLLSMGTPELYGAADPYQRAPKSPKKPEQKDKEDERSKSPASDQLNGVCLSPTGGTSKGVVKRGASEKSENLRRSRSQDKLEGSTFSRSRSSSISSLENISSEAIQCLAFADSYTKKNESQLCPTLWVGTSLGSVIQVVCFLPPSPESRATSPVNVAPSGTIFRLKGSILAMSFLDCNGALIPYTFESWRDANRENRKLERTPTKSQVNCRMSPTNSGEQTWGDRQFVVIASDKVARVVALPSHNCVYKQIITEVSFVVKAEIIQMKDAVCLVCYIGTGHISIFSLPSLRQLIYTDFLPLTDLRIARTFCFTNYGHGLYLCSPSEIQKFTVSSDFCKDMQDLLGNLFVPCETPEPPKQSFFKGFFGGGVSQLDRDELFGESSGKPARSVAKHIPGPNMQVQELNTRSQTVGSEVAKTRMMLVERGEKLGQLDDKAAKMMAESENFSSTAHQIMLKYKDKKWYQL